MRKYLQQVFNFSTVLAITVIMLLAIPITVTAQVELPLTFENGVVTADDFEGLRGSEIEVVTNPDISGINTSDNTGKFIKGDQQPYAGMRFTLASPFQAEEHLDRVIRMKVWSPRDSVQVRLELQSDGQGNKALFDTVWTAEEWVELEYDLSELDPEIEYLRVFSTYDWDGGPGDGTDDWIWYFDDFDIVTTKYSVKTPLTFEDGVDANYFNGQRGSEIEVVANPDASGINTSGNTGKFIKGDEQPFAGFNFDLANPINTVEDEDRVIKMKVWSPRDSVEVRLELKSDGEGNKALFDTVWTAEEWVELEFDLSEAEPGVDYINIFQTYDWDGGPGDGTEDWIWYFDDFNVETKVITYEVELPLTFEDGIDANYFNGQRGSEIEVVANPDASGINTSGNTGKFIKGDEQPFAGFNFDLANPINTVEDEDRVIKMKVWSPRDSVEVRLELKSDGEGNKALFDTVWTAEEWVELEFDLSEAEPGVDYINIFQTYDWDGGPGDGTEDWIWYFDDFNVETKVITYEVELPLTFEDGIDANYFNGQRGSEIEVVANPDASGLNTSDNTGKFIKGDEQPFAGFNFLLANSFQAEENEDRLITMKVWSPRDSVEVRLELQSDGQGNKALFDTVWTAEEWVELEFNLSGVDPEVEYIRIFTTYDWDGGPGDGTDNWIWYFDDFNIVPGIDVGTEVEEIPSQFSLSQNYPNPFNPTTNIQFELAASSQVTLTIFNVLGQKVAVLLDNNKMNAGTHTAVFDANVLSSGVYFYRLEAGSFVQQKNMTLIK